MAQGSSGVLGMVPEKADVSGWGEVKPDQRLLDVVFPTVLSAGAAVLGVAPPRGG